MANNTTLVSVTLSCAYCMSNVVEVPQQAPYDDLPYRYFANLVGPAACPGPVLHPSTK